MWRICKRRNAIAAARTICSVSMRMTERGEAMVAVRCAGGDVEGREGVVC